MRKLTQSQSPSFLSTSIPVPDALDLGCGDGQWVVHAAQVWGDHGTKLVGVDLPFSTEDSTATPSEPNTENPTLLRHNLCVPRTNAHASNSLLIVDPFFCLA